MFQDLLTQWSEEGKIPQEKAVSYLILAEVIFGGAIHPIRSLLAKAIKARKEGKKGIFVHSSQVEEAAIVNDIQVFGVEEEEEILHFLNGQRELNETIRDTRSLFKDEQETPPNDMADIIEDENAKQAENKT